MQPARPAPRCVEERRMNRVQACRTTDERSEERPGAPLAGLDAPFDELPGPVSGRRARSAADTLRYADADPFADTMAVPESPTSARLARPDWCVDLPPLLLTMSTFELWAAIEQARVTPEIRVWREGLECWTRVDHLPELGWALPVTPAPPVETAPASTPVSFAPPAAAPPRRDEPRPATAPPPSLSLVQATPRQAPGGGRWIALGSAVAAASLATAILVMTFRAPSPPPAPQAFAGAAPPVEAVPASSPDPAPERRDEALHHDERGQRRLPRGGRRAYGR
jgi:hypothetical protein